MTQTCVRAKSMPPVPIKETPEGLLAKIKKCVCESHLLDSDDIEANEPSCEPREQLVKIPFPETDGKHVIEIHPQVRTILLTFY